jgi:hypothetical protein
MGRSNGELDVFDLVMAAIARCRSHGREQFLGIDRGYIETNRAALDRLRAFIDRLSEDDLTKSLSDGWTVAATLAHLAFWDRRALLLLQRFAKEGISPSPYDVHIVNDAMLPQQLLIPAKQAVAEVLAAAEAADAAAAAVSDELGAAILAGKSEVSLIRAAHRRYHLDELEPLFP